MKTYARRKPVAKIIENVHALCRLCLQNIRDSETVSLFASENEKLCPSLTRKIMICLGFEVVNEECLPNRICLDCDNKINKYYTFRKNCGVAYQALKSHLSASKQINANHIILKTEETNVIKQPDVPAFNGDEKIVITFEDNKQLDNNTTEVGNGDHDSRVNEAQENILPDISKFLNIILLELGIISKTDEDHLHSEYLGRTIELETGDGCQTTFHLAEIVDKDSNVTTDPQTCDSTQDEITTVEEKPELKNGRAVCRVCGKAFVSRGVLRRHARIHSGERPHACRSCPRRFTQREVLRRHELVHLEKRPFACDQCPKSFTQRNALNTHRRSHAPPSTRPFELHRCLVCPKFFLHASGLSRHARAHTVQPQAACGTCGRTFRDRYALQRHARRVHATRDEPSATPT